MNDAIQALFPVTRKFIYLNSAADGHKDLCGPEGNALLYVSDRALDHIQPTAVGWMSVPQDGSQYRYELRYREGCDSPCTFSTRARKSTPLSMPCQTDGACLKNLNREGRKVRGIEREWYNWGRWDK